MPHLHYLVLLVYGLSFFCLGVVVATYPKQGSALPLGRALRWFAAFGFLHGAHEWVALHALIDGEVPRALTWVDQVLAVASFFCMAQFGAELVAAARPGFARFAAPLPFAFLTVWATAVLAGPADLSGASAARLLIGLPGTLLAARGVFIQVPAGAVSGGVWQVRTGRFGWNPVNAARALAATLAVYALLVGVVFDSDSGSLQVGLDAGFFKELVGVPVELPRAFCAITMTLATLELLNVFRAEEIALLQARVADRTDELRRANLQMASEVAERRAAEAATSTMARHLREMVDMAPYSLALLDPELRYLHVNRHHVLARDTDPRTVVGRTCYEAVLDRTHPCTECPAIESVKTGRPATREWAVPRGATDGPVTWTRVTAWPLFGDDGSVARIIVRNQDVTGELEAIAANKREIERLSEISRTDPLTGLANRKAAFGLIGDELDRVRRYGGALSLALFDLDGFKPINDELGHAAGDEVLRQVAAALKGALRTTDLVGRLGGDEFLVVLPVTDEAGAMMLGDRCLGRLRDLKFVLPGGETVGGVRASVGVCTCEGAWAGTTETAVAEADRAMYSAKGAGGGRVAHASRTCGGPAVPPPLRKS